MCEFDGGDKNGGQMGSVNENKRTLKVKRLCNNLAHLFIIDVNHCMVNFQSYISFPCVIYNINICIFLT